MKYKKLLVVIISILVISGIVCLCINPFKKEEKKIIDKKVPSISVINEIVYTDGNSSFNPVSNIKVEYGKKGGKTKCDTDTLKLGENTITCIAKGNNKLSSKISYKVIMSKTYQKKAIFFGDSIVYGFSSSPVGYSWANYIGDNYDLETSVNAGITDYRVSTYDDPKKWLVDEVKNHYNDSVDYDYIILEGGINDVLYNTPIGNISQTKDINSFDPNTFCGGLESYLYYVTNKWNNSKIGYIITYYTPNYTERGLKWSYNDYKKYYDKTIEILNKWNIKYISFATDEFNSKLDVEKKTYLPDYLHLNNEGYKIVSPYIYEFMQTLDNYK